MMLFFIGLTVGCIITNIIVYARMYYQTIGSLVFIDDPDDGGVYPLLELKRDEIDKIRKRKIVKLTIRNQLDKPQK